MKWAKLSRRGTALFLSAAAVWCLVGASGTGQAAGRTPRSDAVQTPSGTSGLWERLLVGQSPYLQHGKVLTFTEKAAQTEPNQTAETVPSPAPTPTAVQDEETPIPQTSTQSQNVISQTLLPATDGSYPSAGGVFL